MGPREDVSQVVLRVMRGAFLDYGRWRVTHVEPTGMSHTEYVTAGQLATIAFDALVAAGWRLIPPDDFPGLCPSCKTVIEPGTHHGPFNGNQMFACEIIRDV